MANLIYACWSSKGRMISPEALRSVTARISFDDGSVGKPAFAFGESECLCMTSPGVGVLADRIAGRLGAFAEGEDRWSEVGAREPDGTYAIVRSNSRVVEALTDHAGSRTLWYVFTPEAFFVSTSQRALVALLGDYQLDRTAAAWFVSSGSLGPESAWDRRIVRIPRASKLVFDRQEWRVRVETSPIRFRTESRSRPEWGAALAGVLEETVGRFELSHGGWVLPLSGGYDCRFILGVLVECGFRPKCVTWGLAESIHMPGNDAYVARKLAAHYGLEHAYLHTDVAEAPPAEIADTFLRSGAGGCDQLFPYLDGMALWRTLREQGVRGIVRGDEGFGWIPVRDEQHARTSVGLMLLSDFLDESLAEQFGDAPQILPDAFRKLENETVESYRDRMYHQFRIPIGLAALNDVKTPFVEVVCPLVCRPILELVRTMPDRLRTDKALFRAIATAASPPIPYASMGADDDRASFLQSESFSCWMEESLGSSGASKLYPASFLAGLASSVRRTPPPWSASRSLRSRLKRIVPSDWLKALRKKQGAQLPSDRLLALRCSLAARMTEILEQDARALDSSKPSAL